MTRYVRPEPPAEVLHQVQHGRGGGDVEAGRRLVGDEELGLERERARDADAARLTARELVRVLAGQLGRELDHLQQLAHADLVRRAGPC